MCHGNFPPLVYNCVNLYLIAPDHQEEDICEFLKGNRTTLIFTNVFKVKWEKFCKKPGCSPTQLWMWIRGSIAAAICASGLRVPRDLCLKCSRPKKAGLMGSKAKQAGLQDSKAYKVWLFQGSGIQTLSRGDKTLALRYSKEKQSGLQEPSFRTLFI